MSISVQKFIRWKRVSYTSSYSAVLLLIIVNLLSPFNHAHAQEMDDKKTWSIGFQAGVLSGNLSQTPTSNAILSRFNVEKSAYFTASFQTEYALSEYESLILTLNRSEFSVFTDYEFWPDVTFKNKFYTGTLSVQLGLRRFIEALPNRLEPYGSFGLGLMNNHNTVSPINPQGTTQNDFSDDQSRNLSFLFTTGVGLNYSLNSRISILFQFNHNFLSNDIIDKNLAGEVLQNDFVQTTNNWSTFTSGFKIKFGRSKKQSQPEPVRNDFPIVSTFSPDSLIDSEDEISDLTDNVVENTLDPDSTQIQTGLNEELIDSTEVNLITEDTGDSLTTSEIPEAEEGAIIENYDDLVFVTQSRYGLTGIAVENIIGSFTIVLHSFSDHDAANDIIDYLNSEGYRVVTQIRNVNGVDFKRVGVGQFETRNDAHSAAQNLPESYNNNYFIAQN